MNISQALSWLDSLINYEKGFQKYKKTQYNVSVLAGLLDKKYDDWKSIPVVHIAGTKGKGSVARYISHGIQLSGRKAGLFTSPHYFHINERIAINGRSISDADLAALISDSQQVIADNNLTYFEALTYIAMIQFLDKGCDVIILETGLGGRLDSTNFHPSPAATLITHISYDHTAVLGNTLELIAREKAGIIKKGCPLISVDQNPLVKEVLLSQAIQKQAPWYFLPMDFPHSLLKQDREGSHVIVKREGHPDESVIIRQWGKAYIESFKAALLCLDLLHIETDPGLISQIASLQFPFHIQMQSNRVLDVSHNPASIKLLFDSLREHAGITRFTLYLGILADKELERIADTLNEYKQYLQKIILFQIPHSSRPDGMQDMAEILEQKGLHYKRLNRLEDLQLDPAGFHVFTGSFYSIPVLAPLLAFPPDLAL